MKIFLPANSIGNINELESLDLLRQCGKTDLQEGIE